MNKNRSDEVINYLRNLDKVGIAFSGGVDSSLLAVLATQALGNDAHIFTIVTPYMSKAEIADAQKFAKRHNLNHQLVDIATPSTILNNPIDRCYRCKTVLFSQVLEKAKTMGIKYILDGSNADDVSDYRPGMKALKELRIKSPFLELGISKLEVRNMSKELALETWDTPSNPCLLTRLPYDKAISEKALQQVEKAEKILHSKGFRIVRVRHQDDTARIEVPKEDQAKMLEQAEIITALLKDLGFTFVSLDLKGFKSGNMNQSI